MHKPIPFSITDFAKFAGDRFHPQVLGYLVARRFDLDGETPRAWGRVSDSMLDQRFEERLLVPIMRDMIGKRDDAMQRFLAYREWDAKR